LDVGKELTESPQVVGVGCLQLSVDDGREGRPEPAARNAIDGLPGGQASSSHSSRSCPAFMAVLLASSAGRQAALFDVVGGVDYGAFRVHAESGSHERGVHNDD
jgi:hypothetical protein